MSTTSAYLFNQPGQRERDRLAALERFFHPSTTRVLEDLGVGPGWRCLDVGAGAGAITRWLGERVGPDGRVIATDLDTRFLSDLHGGPVEVWRHDIVEDGLPAAAFDLVHVRTVLEHLPQRDAVLPRLVESLAPGGCLVVSDGDLSPATVAAVSHYLRPAEFRPLYEKAVAAVAAMFRLVGAHPWWGRELPSELAAAGLTDVGATITAPLTRAGGDSDWIRLCLQQVREPILRSGMLTEDDFAGIERLAHHPDCRYVPLTMITAWGRSAPRAPGGTGRPAA